MLPAELRPDGRVVVRGRVDGGETGLVGARVEVRRAAARSTSVSSLERWTAAVDPQAGADAGEEFEDPAATARTDLVLELGDVPAGGSVPFTATLEPGALRLRSTEGAAGAYGLQLLLIGDDGAGGGPGDGSGEGSRRGLRARTPRTRTPRTRTPRTRPARTWSTTSAASSSGRPTSRWPRPG